MTKTILNVPIYKIIIYVVILILAVIFLRYPEILLKGNNYFSQSNIEAFVLKAGVFSWLVYILVVAVVSLSPLPSSVLGLVAGYLFNPILAIIFTLIGQFLGAWGNYIVGKKIIGNLLNEGKLPNIALLINKFSKHLKPRVIFILGLIPVSTANITAYAAGLSGLTLKEYIIPWMAGMGVLSILTILLGHSGKIHSSSLSIAIIIIVIAILILAEIFGKLIDKNNDN